MEIGDDRDGDELPYVGQMHNTLGVLLLELQLKTAAFETLSILKDQVWIKMRVHQVWPEETVQHFP